MGGWTNGLSPTDGLRDEGQKQGYSHTQTDVWMNDKPDKQMDEQTDELTNERSNLINEYCTQNLGSNDPFRLFIEEE